MQIASDKYANEKCGQNQNMRNIWTNFDFIFQIVPIKSVDLKSTNFTKITLTALFLDSELINFLHMIELLQEWKKVQIWL